jgi:uncharacterized protein YecT (DUF1311 family)
MSSAGGVTPHPSFSCTAKGDSVEQAICSDVALSRLDVELASLYGNLRHIMAEADAQALVVEQRIWLGKLRSEWCTTVECLTARYQMRIEELVSEGARLGIADARADLRPGQSAAINGLVIHCTAAGVKVEPSDQDPKDGPAFADDGSPRIYGRGVLDVTRADCLVTDGSTIRLKSGLKRATTGYGMCGASPAILSSVWVEHRKVMSSLEFTDSCGEFLIDSMTFTPTGIDYCLSKDIDARFASGSRFPTLAGTCGRLAYDKASGVDLVEFPGRGDAQLVPERLSVVASGRMKGPCEGMIRNQASLTFSVKPPAGSAIPAWVKRSAEPTFSGTDKSTLRSDGIWSEATFDLDNTGKASTVYMMDSGNHAFDGTALGVGGDDVLEKEFDPHESEAPVEGLYVFVYEHATAFVFEGTSYLLLEPANPLKSPRVVSLHGRRVDTVCTFERAGENF